MNYIYIIQKFIFLCFLFSIISESINKKNVTDEGNINSIDIVRRIKDVLFINGCNIKNLPHPYRYRVLHQMEELDAGFLESDAVDYLNFDPIIVRDYRVIIFFRCPWTENVDEAITLTK